jgi:hypothetical protein
MGHAFRFSYCVKVAALRFGPKVVDESLWDIRLWHGQPKTLLIAVMAGPAAASCFVEKPGKPR